MRGRASRFLGRGGTFRGLLSWNRLCTAIGESTQCGDAGNRRYGVVYLVAGRDKGFELRQDRIHRPDHWIGQREVAFDAIDGLVETLGRSRQILHEIWQLTRELYRSRWDAHRSAGDRLRRLRRCLCGGLDVFRARNLLAHTDNDAARRLTCLRFTGAQTGVADKYAAGMANVLTVNVAHPRPNSDKGLLLTGIDKRPTDGPIGVRAPGPMHGGVGSGLVGDFIGDSQVHGGDDQAVYAYAREDLDVWQRDLEHDLSNGMFGENLTTEGLDVTGARIGERWQVGSGGLVLEVSQPRVPCRTFATWLAIRGWVKTFTNAATPGAYLRVIAPGAVRGGDSIVVVDRPKHDVTGGLVFRALTLEPELLPRLLAADALPDEIKELARRRAS